MRIDTNIDDIIVEIEDVEYPLAAKTVDVAEKLIANQHSFLGQPEYKKWLADLEVVLGKTAVKKLFKNGKSENIDRMERIYKGVFKAFSHNSDELEEEQRQSRLEGISEQIKPITELMKQVNAVSGTKNTDKNYIRRS